jgi:predicted Fe-Mo cluster-binding NifX family protein
MNTVVAVPSEYPGGLEATLSSHFGHCDVFTLVAVENGQIKEVKIVPNSPHEQGGCMAPVNLLAQSGAKILIAGGMGMRPLMGFNSVNIQIFYNGGATRVGQAVNALIVGNLQPFGQDQTCGGGAHDPAHVGGACRNP